MNDLVTLQYGAKMTLFRLGDLWDSSAILCSTGGMSR